MDKMNETQLNLKKKIETYIFTDLKRLLVSTVSHFSGQELWDFLEKSFHFVLEI